MSSTAAVHLPHSRFHPQVPTLQPEEDLAKGWWPCAAEGIRVYHPAEPQLYVWSICRSLQLETYQKGCGLGAILQNANLSAHGSPNCPLQPWGIKGCDSAISQAWNAEGLLGTHMQSRRLWSQACREPGRARDRGPHPHLCTYLGIAGICDAASCRRPV